jgi:hypothetical protein
MIDAAAEPLITTNREYPHDARYSGEDTGDVEVSESALVAPGLFIWGLTICAGVSGLLFGYEYVTHGVAPVPPSLPFSIACGAYADYLHVALASYPRP